MNILIIEDDAAIRQELKLLLRYHSSAILGLLQDWTPEDTKNLDGIVHEVYQIMVGGITAGTANIK